MRKNKIDTNMPIGELKRIDDFLPHPSELAVPEKTVKITLRLSRSSVDYFKEQARKYHTKYQKMLRMLVDRYAEKYS